MKTLLRSTLFLAFAFPAFGQTNFNIHTATELPTHQQGTFGGAITSVPVPNGRYMIQETSARLGSGDMDLLNDIYSFDMQLKEIELISVSFTGAAIPGNGPSTNPSVSDNGRFVVFSSGASDLIPSDLNATSDVFLRDTFLNTTVRINEPAVGGSLPAGAGSSFPRITPNGKWVVFSSLAPLVAGDTNGVEDIYRWNRTTLALSMVSTQQGGGLSSGASKWPAVSQNGRFVSFRSAAANLVAGDTNGVPDVFRKDMNTGAVTLISMSTAGAQQDGSAFQTDISGDGQVIAFYSLASNLVPGDTNGSFDLFVHSIAGGVTSRVNVTPAGTQSNAPVSLSTHIPMTPDGQYVLYSSPASDIISGDTNGAEDVFLLDRSTSTAQRISLGWDGSELNGDSSAPRMTSDFQRVSFATDATNAIQNDLNNLADNVVVLGLTTLGSRYCSPAVANSTGVPGTISAIGSSIAADNNVELIAGPLPINEMGIFLAGQAQGNFPMVGGGLGTLCLSPPFARLAPIIQDTGIYGVLYHKPDLSSIPLTPPVAILAGETWNFQCYHRDLQSTNLTNAVAVTFL